MPFNLDFILDANPEGLVQGMSVGRKAVSDFTAAAGRDLKQLEDALASRRLGKSDLPRLLEGYTSKTKQLFQQQTAYIEDASKREGQYFQDSAGRWRTYTETVDKLGRKRVNQLVSYSEVEKDTLTRNAELIAKRVEESNVRSAQSYKDIINAAQTAKEVYKDYGNVVAGLDSIVRRTRDEFRAFRQQQDDVASAVRTTGITFRDLPALVEGYSEATGRLRNEFGKFESTSQRLSDLNIRQISDYRVLFDAIETAKKAFKGNVPVLNQLITLGDSLADDLMRTTGATYDASKGIRVLTSDERLLRQEGILTSSVIEEQEAKFERMFAAASSPEEVLQVAKALKAFRDAVSDATSQQDQLAAQNIRSTQSLKEEWDRLKELTQAHQADSIAVRQLDADKARLAITTRQLAGAHTELEANIRSELTADQQLRAEGILTTQQYEEEVKRITEALELAAQSRDKLAFGNLIVQLEQLENRHQHAAAAAEKQAEAMGALTTEGENVSIQFEKIGKNITFGSKSVRDQQRFQRSLKTSNYALQNFSFIVQDASQFMVGGKISLAQGLRAVANNFDATLYSIVQTQEAIKLLNPQLADSANKTKLWGETFRTLGRSLKSPLGFLVLFNTITTGLQFLTQLLDKGKKQVEAYQKSVGEVVKPIDQWGQATIATGDDLRDFLRRQKDQIDSLKDLQKQYDFLALKTRQIKGLGLGTELIDVSSLSFDLTKVNDDLLKFIATLPVGRDYLKDYNEGLITFDELLKKTRTDLEALKEGLDEERKALLAADAAARAKADRLRFLAASTEATQQVTDALGGAIRELTNRYDEARAASRVFGLTQAYSLRSAVEAFTSVSKAVDELNVKLGGQQSVGIAVGSTLPGSDEILKLPDIPDEIKIAIDFEVNKQSINEYLAFIDEIAKAEADIIDANTQIFLADRRVLNERKATAAVTKGLADAITELAVTREITASGALLAKERETAIAEQRLAVENAIIDNLKLQAQLDDKAASSELARYNQERERLELQQQLQELQSRDVQEEFNIAAVQAGIDLEEAKQATLRARGTIDFAREVAVAEQEAEAAQLVIEAIKAQVTDRSAHIGVLKQEIEAAEARRAAIEAEARTVGNQKLIEFYAVQKESATKTLEVMAKASLLRDFPGIFGRAGEIEAAERVVAKEIELAKLQGKTLLKTFVGTFQINRPPDEKLAEEGILDKRLELEKSRQETIKLQSGQYLQGQIGLQKLRESNARLELDILSLQATAATGEEALSFRLDAERELLEGRKQNRSLIEKETAQLGIQEHLLQLMAGAFGKRLDNVRDEAERVQHLLDLTNLRLTSAEDLLDRERERIETVREEVRIEQATGKALQTQVVIAKGLTRTVAQLQRAEDSRKEAQQDFNELLREQATTYRAIFDRLFLDERFEAERIRQLQMENDLLSGRKLFVSGSFILEEQRIKALRDQRVESERAADATKDQRDEAERSAEAVDQQKLAWDHIAITLSTVERTLARISALEKEGIPNPLAPIAAHQAPPDSPAAGLLPTAIATAVAKPVVPDAVTGEQKGAFSDIARSSEEILDARMRVLPTEYEIANLLRDERIGNLRNLAIIEAQVEARERYERVLAGTATLEEFNQTLREKGAFGGGVDLERQEEESKKLEDLIERDRQRAEDLPKTIGQAWAETAGAQKNALRDMGLSMLGFLFTTEEGMQTLQEISGNTFGAIAEFAQVAFDASDKKNKKWFRLMKAAKVAEAIISTYTAANLAAAQTGIFAPLVVPGIIALGLANVAKIIATEPGSSSKGGPTNPGASPDAFASLDINNPAVQRNRGVGVTFPGGGVGSPPPQLGGIQRIGEATTPTAPEPQEIALSFDQAAITVENQQSIDIPDVTATFSVEGLSILSGLMEDSIDILGEIAGKIAPANIELTAQASAPTIDIATPPPTAVFQQAPISLQPTFASAPADIPPISFPDHITVDGMSALASSSERASVLLEEISAKITSQKITIEQASVTVRPVFEQAPITILPPEQTVDMLPPEVTVDAPVLKPEFTIERPSVSVSPQIMVEQASISLAPPEVTIERPVIDPPVVVMERPVVSVAAPQMHIAAPEVIIPPIDFPSPEDFASAIAGAIGLQPPVVLPAPGTPEVPPIDTSAITEAIREALAYIPEPPDENRMMISLTSEPIEVVVRIEGETRMENRQLVTAIKEEVRSQTKLGITDPLGVLSK